MRSMIRVQFIHAYKHIISVENMLETWQGFVRGKRYRKDMQEFERDLIHNILALHRNLVAKTYTHSAYEEFNISDPKPRIIHKASVRDRLLHHMLYRKLYPFFDRIFIVDSYSCRKDKGTHKAINRFQTFAYQVSKNNTRTCWVLQCDIRKFFANIDHAVLMKILQTYILDADIVQLLEEVVNSFSSIRFGLGVPLGNLTSQLLVNIYMNELDQFVKHKLKAIYYIRYADDFIILSEDHGLLEGYLLAIRNFLYENLKLELHPDKVFIKTLASGIDFLGWVHFPDHRVLRTATKRRMMRHIRGDSRSQTIQSYLGLLRYGNTFGLQHDIEEKTEED